MLSSLRVRLFALVLVAVAPTLAIGVLWARAHERLLRRGDIHERALDNLAVAYHLQAFAPVYHSVCGEQAASKEASGQPSHCPLDGMRDDVVGACGDG